MEKNAPILNLPIEFTDQWYQTPEAKFLREIMGFCKQLVDEVLTLRAENASLRKEKTKEHSDG